VIFSDGNSQAEARSKKSASKKSSSRRGVTSSRSSRSQRSNSRSSRGSSRKVRSSRRGERGRPLSRAEKRRAARNARVSKAAPPPPKPTPTPEQIEARDRRHRAYGDMAHAYSLYDAGANARLAGNYADAIDKLNQSARLFNNANDYQHSGTSGTIESMVHFELGMAAEAAQDFGLARDSYQRCLIIRPNFTQASVRLVDMLARIGQGPLALAKAQEAVSANPSDPRSHLLLGLMLEKLAGRPGKSLARIRQEDS